MVVDMNVMLLKTVYQRTGRNADHSDDQYNDEIPGPNYI